MTDEQIAAKVQGLLRDAVTVCMVTSHIEHACIGSADFVEDFDRVYVLACNWPPSKWAEILVGVGRAPSEKLRNLVLYGLKQRFACRAGVDG